MSDLQLGFDYIADNSLTGYRLDRLEVLNWGTFHQQIWSLNLRGRNTLLTGDIGTGKSTLVDAVTTLLVPAHRVAYNKAAGAARRERTLRSYVLGYYKAERGESGDYSSRPVALREDDNYSVILGVFKNVGYMQTVTLAQVFWVTDSTRQPRRFYVGAERDMSIADDFSRFGGEINTLRRKLRQRRVTIWDTFPPYGAWFRRRFGIHNDQAMDLFHQTVSMKSVGNLTGFVRQHMLERFDSSSRIDALISHFEDLTGAHDAVLRAKRQIELLKPLIDACDRYQSLEAEIEQKRNCRDALDAYFADLRSKLLEERRDSDLKAKAEEAAQIARCKTRRTNLANERAELAGAIARAGGDRLSRLDAEIDRLHQERKRRKQRAENYGEFLGRIGERNPSTNYEFLAQRRRLGELATELGAKRKLLDENLLEARVLQREKETEVRDVASEIKSLRARRSNIPADRFELRRRLVEAVGIAGTTVPFAGELIAVKPKESAWEGALERLLRDFGLSLLVRDPHYAEVASWVDGNHLGGRLTYFRVRNALRRREYGAELHRDSAVKKILVKPDAAFRDWIEQELARRFDFACCSSAEQFSKEPSAITKAGQIKRFGELHEKDDRYRIDDRPRYVLGWTNVPKIRALESTERTLNARLAGLRQDVRKLNGEIRSINGRINILSSLSGPLEFQDIDWRTLSKKIAALIDQRNELESASDMLKHLRDQLADVDRKIEDANLEWENRTRLLADIESKIAYSTAEIAKAQAIFSTVNLEDSAMDFANLTEIQTDLLGTRKLTLTSCDDARMRIATFLKERIQQGNHRAARIRDRIIRSMKDYNKEYSNASSDVDVSIESIPEYRQILRQLIDDDLPSFESQFKKLLNENTIREIANFQALLDRERESIKEKIERINGSLSQIPFNRNRYIQLEGEPTVDRQIAEFRRDLRRCTEGSLTGSEDDQYSEAKFVQVKAIIDRFKGREGKSEGDLRWTTKVTDVRNWFAFGAIERHMADGSEYEHYSDSSGKSGGQKEKLAYTILAASLTYQFGLEWGAIRSRAFRFVVIDEAFGRGSDESARYALTLFSKLNLQLLIVTPLQKIYVIEPFVESVGFIDIEDDRESRLCNLSIQEYQERKETATVASGAQS